MAFDLFDDAPTPGPFTILTVCTGNICRSPLAEALLRLLLQQLPVTVRSAGTHALVGSPMTDPTLRIASDLGVLDGTRHRAQQLTAELIRDADLVLALTRDHRRAVVEALPRASRVTFTLREFARLAQATMASGVEVSGIEDAGARMRAAVKLAAQARGTVEAPADLTADDVIDPYRRSDEVYARSADQLIPAVNSTAALMRAASQGTTSRGFDATS